ncbi:aldo/keto reductase family protein [Hirsutella rhossiliensis]|uniref:Aldo/keto reductase family domain-containing protein n=1 Tax=Hirsutella rhossiliensis TaxID=111463 RepID=A0A9P8SDM1_9HYPO|nr:aldo/keto reductase family domain-containing protein [Hirsutella rhossiliensis]KAH0958893.1 aldo/keto reductase family domain-containing protein [Hirsutella rhossiliensis]
MAAKSFKLNTGTEMPAVGLGTWQSKPGEVQDAVSYALQAGYRLVDCAYCYGNEDEVGQGLKEAFDAGVKREHVFVMTKVWATYNTRVAEGLEKSLKSLGLDYVDLFLIHWPILLNPQGNHEKFPTLPDGSRDVVHGWNHVEAWKQMEALLSTGKVKAIGVCNYSKRYLEELLLHCTVVPAINQIENHPSLPQQEVVDLCKAKGIHVVAYSPLGSTGSPLMRAEPVAKIAEKKGVSAGTVLLSYHVARGSTVLAKSVTPARIKSNLDLVELDAADMKLLDDYSADLAKKGELKRYVYPPFGVDFGFPDKS